MGGALNQGVGGALNLGEWGDWMHTSSSFASDWRAWIPVTGGQTRQPGQEGTFMQADGAAETELAYLFRTCVRAAITCIDCADLHPSNTHTVSWGGHTQHAQNCGQEHKRND